MKTKTTHTPGPWQYRRQVECPTGTTDLYGVGPVDDHAIWFVAENLGWEDAILIAAAPDLLEAAKKTLAYLETLPDRVGGQRQTIKLDREYLLRRAISLAEGGKS